jgi:hypothetical protein
LKRRKFFREEIIFREREGKGIEEIKRSGVKVASQINPELCGWLLFISCNLYSLHWHGVIQLCTLTVMYSTSLSEYSTAVTVQRCTKQYVSHSD